MSEPIDGRKLLAIRARTARAGYGEHQSLRQTETDREALLREVYRLRARDAIKRVEALADDYAAQVVEVEDDHDGPIPWTDTISVVVARIREAIAGPTPPKGWIRDTDVPESNADAPSPVSAATEAHGETTEEARE